MISLAPMEDLVNARALNDQIHASVNRLAAAANQCEIHRPKKSGCNFDYEVAPKHRMN